MDKQTPPPSEPAGAKGKRSRVSFAFMRQAPAHWIALGFGSGLWPWGPGTSGTLWAWLVFIVINPWLTDASWAALILLTFLIGIWACERTGKALGVADHGAVVIDEVVAFWAVLWIAARDADLGWQALAFVTFRLFDMLKPPPIGWVDRQVKGGIGVMLDDVVAAAMTLLTLALIKAWQEGGLGF